MARVRITLDRELLHQARERATGRGTSLSGYVRLLISDDLEVAEPKADVSAVFNLGDSRSKGLPPIEDWDAAIGEAIIAEAREEGWLD